jgi:hypothetical protein
MRKFKLIIYLFLGVATISIFSACQKEDALFTSQPTEYSDNKVAVDWMEMARTLTKNCSGFSPPVASRAFGYMGITLYEAVVPGMPQFQSLQGQLADMIKIPAPDTTLEYSWPVAANAAMAFAAQKYYANMPAESISLVLKLESSTENRLRQQGMTEVVFNRSKAWGQNVARLVFEWSKSDGGHEGYLRNFPNAYKPPLGLGFWVPTAPAFEGALQPYWGNNRTFIPRCTEMTQPTAPMAFSTDTNSLFHKEALIVYRAVKNIKPEEKTIAQFWSDDPGNPGTPPGHSVSIATQVCVKENLNLARTAEVYAKVGIAVADAFVSCWKCKFVHNLMRPITYLRAQVDPSWTPLLPTPPFPEYTSGHSVQSGATAKVLTDLFGSNYAFSDNTHVARSDIDGAPRSFKSFYDFAAEAAISRLYGGIHYREAIDKGIEQGIRVGGEVSKLKFRR